MNKRITLLIFRGAVYALGLGALLYYLYQSPYNPHPETAEDIRVWIAGFGALAPLMYLTVYTIRPLLFFPAFLLNLSAGVLFGPWLGVLFVLLGGLGCACLCYVLGRFGGGRWILANFGGQPGEKLRTYLVGSSCFTKLLWLRTVPVFPYDPVSIIAGSVLFPFKTYVVATVLGMLPGAVAYNFLADSFGTEKFYWALFVTVLAFGIPLLLWHVRGESSVLKGRKKGNNENEN